MGKDKTIVLVSPNSHPNASQVFAPSSSFIYSFDPRKSTTDRDDSTSKLKPHSIPVCTPLPPASTVSSLELPPMPAISEPLSSTPTSLLPEILAMRHVLGLQPFSWLPTPYRSLLDYFVHVASKSFSAHTYIQDEFCSVLITMALQTSHLLAAVLRLAAIHQIAAGFSQDDTRVLQLTAFSITKCRNALELVLGCPDDAMVATILALCLGDIVSGGEKPQSWRSHLDGAAALLGQDAKGWLSDYASAPYPTARAFIFRWFVSFQTIAHLCGSNPLSPTGSRIALEFARKSSEDYIDDFLGFSPKLIPVFAEISLLLLEQRTINLETEDMGSIKFSTLRRERYDRLVEEVWSMLRSNFPSPRDDVEIFLSRTSRSDLIKLNEAYHHVALLQLYQRLLNLPSTSVETQSSVKEIISLVSDMTLSQGPCPAVALLQPLFTAGCAAIRAEDRRILRNLLETMASNFGLANVRRSIDFLDSLWSYRDTQYDESGLYRWDDYIGMISVGSIDCI